MTNLLPFAGFIVLLVAVLYGLPKLINKKKNVTPEPVTPEKNAYIMKLHGGPADGHIEKIVEPERPLYFVAAYSPKIDEATGLPPEKNVIGHMYGKMMLKPNYAYYRYILDDEYVYVRDLEDVELQNIAITGEPPEAQPRSNDGSEED